LIVSQWISNIGLIVIIDTYYYYDLMVIIDRFQ
jgi:hypothetical protein